MDGGMTGQMNDSREGRGFAFVISALTSVNLIKAVCEFVCVCVCLLLCVAPLYQPAGDVLPLSMGCPSSGSPRLTNQDRVTCTFSLLSLLFSTSNFLTVFSHII